MSNEIKITTRSDGDVCIVMVDGYEQFSISHNVPAQREYELREFYISLCCSGNSAETHSSAVKFRSESENSLGYYFPMNSFSSADQFEDKWAAVYARAAFRYLTHPDRLSETLSDQAIYALKANADQSVNLFDVFDSQLGVVVLGRDALNKFSVTDSHLPLMLARVGICVSNCQVSDLLSAVCKDWLPSVGISILSEEFANDADTFWRLLNMASRAGWEGGSFLILYQCLEYAIERVFEWGIKDIVEPNISTWDLRERLSSLAKESTRLNLLNTYCLKRGVDRAVLDNVGRNARAVLSALGKDKEKYANWTSSLYALRNVVIHSQLNLIRREDVSLKAVNYQLASLCLEIIGFLEKPAREAFWRESSSDVRARDMSDGEYP